MTDWTPEELEAIGDAVELQVASVRPNGTLRPYVTIWTVRSGDDIFVRTAYGPGARWFGHARESGIGSIRAGGIERDVTFEDADSATGPAVDAAYEEKYGRYGKGVVKTVVGEQVHGLTLRLVPRD